MHYRTPLITLLCNYLHGTAADIRLIAINPLSVTEVS